MKAEDALLSAIVRGGGVRQAMKLGVTRDLFISRKAEWRFLESNPSVKRAAFQARFPEFKVYKVDPEELEAVLHTVQAERANFELAKVFQRGQKQFGEVDPLELARKLSKDAEEVIRKFSKGEDVFLLDDIDRSVESVRQRRLARKTGDTVGWPFGVPTFDKVFGGQTSPDLVTLLARQGHMKTWLSLYFATTAMEAGAKCMYISLEMSVEQVRWRVHTLLSRLLAKTYADEFKTVFSNRGLMMGTINIKQYRRFLLRARKRIKTDIIIPDSNTSQSIEQIRGRLEEHHPDLVYYDYFGLAVGEGRLENWMEAEQFSHGLKALAKAYDIAVILNAQANRSGANDKDAPKAEHAAYTDALGRDSDRMLSLRMHGGELTVHVEKNRHGPSGQNIRFETDIDKGVLEEIVMGSRNVRQGRYSDEEVD